MSNKAIERIDVAKVLRERLPSLSRFIPSALVRWLERLICQDELNALLDENKDKAGAEFCRGILKSLNVNVEVMHAERLPAPEQRRVIYVSNHPLGGLDGMALIDIIQKHHGGQVWFIVNDLLMHVKPLESVFLPINKFGSQSRDSLRRIDDAFAGNDPIIMFPAGMVSRLRKVPFEVQGGVREAVVDLTWKKTFVTKAVQYGRDIVPLFFSGVNSMDFYRKARLRTRLGLKFNYEMLLLPREMVNARNKSFSVKVGYMKPYTLISSPADAQAYASSIGAETYQLSIPEKGKRTK